MAEPTLELSTEGFRVFVSNHSTKFLMHVQWFLSPWDANGDANDSKYWSLMRGGNKPVLHAGRFALDAEPLPAGDYRVEWLFATPDGESHHEVQRLVVP